MTSRCPFGMPDALDCLHLQQAMPLNEGPVTSHCRINNKGPHQGGSTALSEEIENEEKEEGVCSFRRRKINSLSRGADAGPPSGLERSRRVW